MTENTPTPDAEVARRDAVMSAWPRIAEAAGWDDTTADVLYWAAVDGLAWSLIEQTVDMTEVQATEKEWQAARTTAEHMLATPKEPTR